MNVSMYRGVLRLHILLEGRAFITRKRSSDFDRAIQLDVSRLDGHDAAFVERDETGMVNAVLDQLARRLRADEFNRAIG